MSVARFLADLFESGRVSVPMPSHFEMDQEIDVVLLSAERIFAGNLAGKEPAFSIESARWAALLFYRACQFVVCRDAEAKTIKAALEEKCPEPHSPRTEYSVDIVFRFLPDVISMTRAVASADPLLQALLKLAREWPLSSVGVAEVGPVKVSAFIEHPVLLQLYADRIVASADTTRLGDQRVDSTVRQALGAYPELCKPIGEALGEMTNDQ